MENEEILQKAVMLKQESEETEKQLDFVNEQIQELGEFGKKLEILGESEEDEMLSGIGRGVYMKTKRDKDKKLFVEVGSGVIVRKNPLEVKEVIEDQIKKFNEAKVQLTAQLHAYAEEFGKMMQEVEKLKKSG